MPADKTMVNYNFKYFQAGKLQPRRSSPYVVFFYCASSTVYAVQNDAGRTDGFIQDYVVSRPIRGHVS